MAQLEFDEETSKRLEAAYAGRDMARRRELVGEALAVGPGDRILDVGCGPGFYVPELLERVGPRGAVVGVDGSASMLELAARRSEGSENVEFHEADATALPVDDASFDAALSVQVLEYVADIPAALAEIRRALRPGGRAVIWDVDWTTVSMRTAEPERMRRMLDAWDEHLTHVALPRTLTAEMRAAGFEDVADDRPTRSPPTTSGRTATAASSSRSWSSSPSIARRSPRTRCGPGATSSASWRRAASSTPA